MLPGDEMSEMFVNLTRKPVKTTKKTEMCTEFACNACGIMKG